MLSTLKTYITQGTVFYGLEVFQVQDNVRYRLLEVKRKKEELIISKSVSFDELTDLKDHAQPSKPTYLVFNTASVMTKLFESHVQMNNEAIVSQRFPGLNFDNFYFQIMKLENSSTLSVVKKDALDALLIQLRGLKFNVAGFSLGPSAFQTLLPHIQNETLLTNTEQLTLDPTKKGISKISKIVPTEMTTYTINGLKVENSELLSFAGVLNLLTNPIPENSNFRDVYQNHASSFRSNRMFRLLLGSFLVIILLILLGNFLLFSHYHSAVQNSSEHLALDIENKKALSTLRQRVEEKETKVDMVLSGSTSKSSFYLDELGATVPGSVVLSEILYQPFLKPIQEKKQIELHKNRIEVLGTCRESEDFSSWVTKLEGLEWIASVETMDYDYHSRNSSIFKIRIHVSEY